MISEDQQYLTAIRHDDRKAFDDLFVKYYPMLCAYARQFVLPADSEELVQEMMVHLWEKRHDIQIETSLHAYLFTAVRNRCLSGFTTRRRQERVHQQIFQEIQEQIEQPDYYIAQELARKIQEALVKLPESYRCVFEMNRFEGLTYQQIAGQLVISPKTVDYRICQSLKILRKELKDYLPLLALTFLQ